MIPDFAGATSGLRLLAPVGRKSLNVAASCAEISQALALVGWYDAGEQCITGG
jgi:hypothetical protein